MVIVDSFEYKILILFSLFENLILFNVRLGIILCIFFRFYENFKICCIFLYVIFLDAEGGKKFQTLFSIINIYIFFVDEKFWAHDNI